MLAITASALVPAAPAVAATAQQPAPAAVTVAHYSFDGTAAASALNDQSGRGLPLRVRSADGGLVRFVPHGTGRAVMLPARCAAPTGACPRAFLEGGDDADLDPGVRPFRYGATVLATAAQVGTGANIMQKGVATTASQWKLQIGRQGAANCVLVGQGSTTRYVARSRVQVTDGRWHQVTCRRTGGTLLVIVDGVTRGTVAVPPAVNVGNTMPLRIGGRNLNARADQFGGAIDEVFAILG